MPWFQSFSTCVFFIILYWPNLPAAINAMRPPKQANDFVENLLSKAVGNIFEGEMLINSFSITLPQETIQMRYRFRWHFLGELVSMKLQRFNSIKTRTCVEVT